MSKRKVIVRVGEGEERDPESGQELSAKGGRSCGSGS